MRARVSVARLFTAWFSKRLNNLQVSHTTTRRGAKDKYQEKKLKETAARHLKRSFPRFVRAFVFWAERSVYCCWGEGKIAPAASEAEARNQDWRNLQQLRRGARKKLFLATCVARLGIGRVSALSKTERVRNTNVFSVVSKLRDLRPRKMYAPRRAKRRVMRCAAESGKRRT